MTYLRGLEPYDKRSKGAQYDFENGCFLNVENALPITKQDEQESLIRAKRVMGNGGDDE